MVLCHQFFGGHGLVKVSLCLGLEMFSYGVCT